MNESDIKKMKNELKLEIQSTKESNNSDMRETGEMIKELEVELPWEINGCFGGCSSDSIDFGMEQSFSELTLPEDLLENQN